MMKTTFSFSLMITALFFAGCVSTGRDRITPTLNISGVQYVSLASLCDSKGISWEYDPFSHVITLNVGLHKINLRIKDTNYLIDGSPDRLPHPVEFYQGIIVVPHYFKAKVLDKLKDTEHRGLETVPLKIKKIVIDAGHGGKDPGAIGKSGLQEKDVNLDVAKRLAALLRQKGFEVIMTRNSDLFVPLEKRVEIANTQRADIFISIHSNANHLKEFKGFEAYCITSPIADITRAEKTKPLSLKEYQGCFSETNAMLQTIVWDMVLTSNHADSFKLADSICSRVKKDLGLPILGIKEANFQVLRGTTMPAVLLELGFLSNANEECLLRNGFYRQQLAESIMQGLLEYNYLLNKEEI